MRGLLLLFSMFMLLTLFWQTYYSDPVNRDKKISAQRAYAATPSAVAVVSAYVSSAHGHVDVRLPNAIANRHAKEFSVEVAGSAEMEAEKIMARACVSRSVLVMSVTHAMQVCAGVRKLFQAFDFGVDKCGVTRTVHVDPHQSGPFQVFNVFVCVVLVYTNLLLIFLQASINRIISADKSGYRNSSNLEVSHDQFFLLRF